MQFQWSEHFAHYYLCTLISVYCYICLLPRRSAQKGSFYWVSQNWNIEQLVRNFWFVFGGPLQKRTLDFKCTSEFCGRKQCWRNNPVEFQATFARWKLWQILKSCNYILFSKYGKKGNKQTRFIAIPIHSFKYQLLEIIYKSMRMNLHFLIFTFFLLLLLLFRISFLFSSWISSVCLWTSGWWNVEMSVNKCSYITEYTRIE